MGTKTSNAKNKTIGKDSPANKVAAAPAQTTPKGGESSPVTLPRAVIANKARVTDPGFVKAKDTIISDQEQSYLNTSIRDLRNVNPIKAIRALARFNGIFSTAVHSYIQMAMSGYKVTAYLAGTHQFDPIGTAAAQSVLASADTLYDYTIGFSDKQSIDGVLESLLKETLTTGSSALELVVNRFRLPERLVPVNTQSFRWKSKGDGTVSPQQQSTQGDMIDLDIPTLFYATTHQSTSSIMARSPLEAALQTLFVYSEFIEDLNRVLRKSGHSRLVLKIVSESVKQLATPDQLSDPTKMNELFNTVRDQITTTVNSLEPEDALIVSDAVEVDMIKTQGEKADYTALLNTLGTMMAASLKSMASVLGLGQGSQNLATAEIMVYLKLCRSIQVPVETVMSRAITLAVRLLTGSDCYVKFAFDPINIRPVSELSAHDSVIFQNWLQKLSLGLITDDEFAHAVGTGPRAPGAPTLSGTMFMQQSATQPKDVQQNNGNATRTVNEGTAQGTPTSQGGGAPQ